MEGRGRGGGRRDTREGEEGRTLVNRIWRGNRERKKGKGEGTQGKREARKEGTGEKKREAVPLLRGIRWCWR
jgi:hypothetical protein